MTKQRRRRYTKVGSTICDAGCMSQEGIKHIVQKPPETWSARTKRHDESCTFLERLLTEKGLKTIREAFFRCGTSKQEGLKPDLVVAPKENAEILDVTVVSDSNEEGMMAAYRKKRERNITEKTS